MDTLTDLSEAKEALIRISKSQAADPWFNADKPLPRGSSACVTVTNVIDFGYFVEFDDGLVGLIHSRNPGGIPASAGDRVEVKILWVDVIQRRMGLQLVSVIQEDVGDLVDGVSTQMNLGLT